MLSPVERKDFVAEYAASIDRMMRPGKGFTSLDLPEDFMEAWRLLDDHKVESFDDLSHAHTKGANMATIGTHEGMRMYEASVLDALQKFRGTMPVSDKRAKRDVG